MSKKVATVIFHEDEDEDEDITQQSLQLLEKAGLLAEDEDEDEDEDDEEDEE